MNKKLEKKKFSQNKIKKKIKYNNILFFSVRVNGAELKYIYIYIYISFKTFEKEDQPPE